MTSRRFRRSRALLDAWPSMRALVLTLLATSGCASPAALAVPPPPSAIPGLEARVARDSGDVDALVGLGSAQRAAGDAARGSELLERAVSLAPDHPGARFHLGLAYEDLDRPAAALSEYQAFLQANPGTPLEDELSGRIRLLRRQQLRVAAREALRRERSLASTPPSGNSVAVFPFVVGSPDDALRPLGRALAEMLATDLSQTDRLTVLERVNVQALLDEMALSESGMVETATAARSGFLLGAGTVVQGRVDGDERRLELDAAVIEVADPRTGERRPVQVADALGRLFELEKELAFELYASMGVALTPAEREAVNQRPTESVQALLAWGRGLEAEDRGAFDEAARQFEDAVSLDPSFTAARSSAAGAASTARAVGTSTNQLATSARSAPADIAEFPLPDVLGRDPAAEVLGTEGFGAPVPVVEVIIRLPGGVR